jgi:DNA processing protein
MLVTNADEMAELVSFGELAGERTPDAAVDPRHVRLLDALSDRAPRSPNDLAARSGLSVADVKSALGALELAGSVSERERGWVKIAAGRGSKVPSGSDR